MEGLVARESPATVVDTLAIFRDLQGRFLQRPLTHVLPALQTDKVGTFKTDVRVLEHHQQDGNIWRIRTDSRFQQIKTHSRCKPLLSEKCHQIHSNPPKASILGQPIDLLYDRPVALASS